MNSRPSRTSRPPVAPLHRGPQAIQSVAASSVHHAPNAALLIDFDNVTMGIRSDLQTELRNLLSSDIVHGKVSVQRAYADWRRYPQYIVPLSESSIDLIFAPAYGSSKKNATDIRLAIDAIELVFTRPEIGTIILLSGDSDFSSLVIKLKEYGKYVIGVGIRESSSDLLVQNCDEYYSYNALAGLVKTSDEEVVKRDPWELVTEAITRMKKNNDVMRSDRLKQVMQEIDSSFDEKNLGISKFSRFCIEAAQRGLLSVNKLENGQLEVAPPHERPASGDGARVQAPAARADENGAREERQRRGRRGGRGRGRDREERVPRDDDAMPEAVAIAESESATPPHGDKLAPAPTVEAAPRVPAAVEPSRPARGGAARPSEDAIGSSGERLSREEAFDLVRRAADATAQGDRAVPAREVRARAFLLLGRDSESLSERNFARILRDAHDADVIDLRRRGDDYEVARAVEAAPVADQLNRAAAAAAHAEPPAPVAPPVPRGMGPRAAGLRGRGRGPAPTRAGAPPAELLMIGVVDDGELAATPAVSPLETSPEVERAASPAAAPVAKRSRGPAAKKRAKAKQPAAKAGRAPAAASDEGKAAAKPRRPRARATAAAKGGSE